MAKMSHVHFVLMMMAATAAGFAGGTVAARVEAVRAAPKVREVTTAGRFEGGSFVLLDGRGRKRGELSMESSPVLRLYDERGRTLWEADRVGIIPAGPTR